MSNSLLILKYVTQASMILGGILFIYWFQYTDEAKEIWSTKIKRLNNQALNQEEKEIKSSSFIQLIKRGSRLLKIWTSLMGIAITSLILMIIIALF